MNHLKKEAREKLHVCAPPRLLTDKVASSGILRSPPRPLNRFRQAARGELGLTRSLERATFGAILQRPRTQRVGGCNYEQVVVFYVYQRLGRFPRRT